MNGYEWQTHQPVINTALDIYDIEFILELGVGHYSTPLFLESGIPYRGIDTEKKWVTEMSIVYDVDIELQDVSFMEPEIIYSKLTDEQRTGIYKYYESLIIPKGFNLLFVDQDATCRLISINALAPKFDIIIYHDHDKEGFENNSYELIDRTGFNSYFMSTPTTGAGLMVRKGVDVGFKDTKAAFDVYAGYFLKKHPSCKTINFAVYE